ncbi:MAG TPA: allantoinase [Thermomicrobiales bacterium]|nr:allantoinase [Thermomicrobiales bacterium]
MTYDLVIRGGQVVSDDGVRRADVAVSDGEIVAVAPEVAGPARESIDAAGLHLFPGVVDPHVHFNEPGRTEWEGWATGSAALAAGGGTVAIDMPLNSSPPTLDGPSFDAKRAAAEASSCVDFALWGGLTPDNVDRLEELAARGVVGFKAFMANSGINDFHAADDLTLYEGMRTAARLGLPVAVHAESDVITSRLAARAVAAGRTGIRDYLASRPAIAEIEAVGRALLLAEETGCALHVVHVSTGRAVALIAAARERGVDVSLESCPHYLIFTEDDLETLGAVAKCAPPLRPAAEVEALWQALVAGRIPFVASDHSPSPPEMKRGDDFFRVWGGISGCQTTLPLLLTEGFWARTVALDAIARWTASAAAARFRLARKGRLAPGCDADIALVDLAADWTLTPDDLRYRHRHSPFIDRRLRGRVRRTILRGQTIMRDGAPIGTARGRLLKPAPGRSIST